MRKLSREGAPGQPQLQVEFATVAVIAIDKASSRGKEADMKKSRPPKGKSPSQLIDARIKELGDWRGKTLGRLRTLVKDADPEVVEEWKWGFPCGRMTD